MEQMSEALDTGANIIVNEMPYNILSRAIEKEIIPFCIKSARFAAVMSMEWMEASAGAYRLSSWDMKLQE